MNTGRCRLNDGIQDAPLILSEFVPKGVNDTARVGNTAVFYGDPFASQQASLFSYTLWHSAGGESTQGKVRLHDSVAGDPGGEEVLPESLAYGARRPDTGRFGEHFIGGHVARRNPLECFVD